MQDIPFGGISCIFYIATMPIRLHILRTQKNKQKP